MAYGISDDLLGVASVLSVAGKTRPVIGFARQICAIKSWKEIYSSFLGKVKTLHQPQLLSSHC